MANKIQELQFELMKLASFNEFDGDMVVESLKSHEELWRGVIMDRAGFNSPDAKDYSEAIDLIKLRDIEDEYWNIDTIYIKPVEGKEKELEELAKSWGADEVDWIEKTDAGKVLRVWFD